MWFYHCITHVYQCCQKPPQEQCTLPKYSRIDEECHVYEAADRLWGG